MSPGGSCFRIQDTGHRTQDTGYRTQDIGHRTQDTGQDTYDRSHTAIMPGGQGCKGLPLPLALRQGEVQHLQRGVTGESMAI